MTIKPLDISVARTLLVAMCVALVCSTMVTAAVYFLKPLQMVFADEGRIRAIVVAAFDVGESATKWEIASDFLDLKAMVFDAKTGLQLESIDGHSFKYWSLSPDTDPARLVVFIKLINGKPDRVILPVQGKGMWSTIYGYLVLQSDLNTIAGLSIYEHGETPGIGDRIQNPGWLESWQGKQIRDHLGNVRIVVSNDEIIPRQHRVDAITGATITSKAVGQMSGHFMGPEGYAATLQTLQTIWPQQNNQERP